MRRIEALHPVGRHDAQAFVGGTRLRLRRGIAEEAALRAVAELQALGAAVEVELNRPQEHAMVALDELDPPAFARRPPPPVVIADSPSSLIVATVDAAKLMSLDGIGAESTRPMVNVSDAHTEPMAVGQAAPARAPESEARAGERDARALETTSPMAGPFDAALHPSVGDLTGEVTAPRAQAARPGAPPPPTMEATPALERLSAAPTGELTLPRALSRPAAPAGPTAPAPASESPSESPTMAGAPPTVPELPASLSPVARARALLRERPPVRIGAGAALALALGWMVSQPYAARAERRVAELRVEADRERYRLAEDARQRVARLDAQADSEAGQAAAGTAALWITVGAAAFAAWWRVT